MGCVSVLLIEDDIDILRSLRDILEDEAARSLLPQREKKASFSFKRWSHYLTCCSST
jgi:hypothetical protein